MGRTLQVLIVEDSEDDTALLLHELKRGSFEPTYERVDSLDGMTSAIDRQTWDIVFADYTMPRFTAITALTLLKERGLDLPFIIVSHSMGEDTAVAAIKAGARDCIIKGDLKRLIPAIERELRDAEDRRERKQAEKSLKILARQQAIVVEIGRLALTGVERSQLMKEVVALIAQNLEVEYCHILELLPEGDGLLLRAGVGWKKGLVGNVTVETGETETGYSLLTRKPVIVEDLQTETRFNALTLLHDHGVVSGMSVLIPGQNRLFGVLGAYTTRRRRFTQDDINFLQAVANLLASSINHEQSEERIRFLAYHDALTQLPNRTLFYDRLQQGILAAIRESKTLALLILDLDRFKEINDTMGHHNGDLLLKQVGSRLWDLLRESDSVARLGGDEFAVLLPDVSYEGAISIAQKALTLLQGPYTIEGENIDVQVSIGIALFPQHGEDAGTLMRHADMAMYVTKPVGHGYSVYSPEQFQQKPRRLALMRELRYAIEREEFLLHYQPKIDLRTKRVIGAEALVRWQHPLAGLIPPDQFIPLAERSGLIKPLTQWVINTALRQCQGWHSAGKEISIAVNLSVTNWQDPELPDQVSRRLQACGVTPGWLELEITENRMMENPAHIAEVLKRLGNVSVIALDAFGTGYSWLSHLKKMPINMIKIDKSFIMDMMADENNTELVISIITLAHKLGLKVVAQGVENKETLDQLAALDCDAAQGYFMAPPLTPQEFTQWIGESPYGLKTA